ncbi:hypothetical protein PVAP13_1NG194300 [Panicum virgatum]|uniref:F-box domain-containing protein n=1 Tax=Panicum virgatum TaxID=38727 RepID=A0A8T0WR96_PANVG|nr:hypothetical protein PVAP13_1NG194300 [Panicum virgatum]
MALIPEGPSPCSSGAAPAYLKFPNPPPHGMEVETPPPPPVTAAAAAISSVLGDDDLLREILLRLGLPTSLLRAALVCRRWLRHASDPTFIRRFRAVHPPRLLGAYLATSAGLAPRLRFLPIRPVPELAAAARRAGAFFDAFKGSATSVYDSRSGRLLVTTFDDRHDSTRQVCGPLSPAGNTAVVPPPPPPPPIQLTNDDECLIYHYGEFLPDDDDGRSYFCVVMGYSELQTTVYLYELQDMSWVVRASAAAQLPLLPPRSRVMLFDNSKFYMLSATNKILVCDFPSSSISVMELPNGVLNKHGGCIMLSRGDGSGIFLVHVKESQLQIFHCGKDSDNPGNWLLVDYICLRQVCANLDMTTWPSVDGQSASVKICTVGDNARFVFLEMFGAVVFLDITSRQADKVYQLTPEDKELVSVRPLMLIWPPVFPPMKEGCDQKESCTQAQTAA